MGVLKCDNGEVVHRWAVAGHCIAYKSPLDVAYDLCGGRLVRLCRDWQGEPAPSILSVPIGVSCRWRCNSCAPFSPSAVRRC